MRDIIIIGGGASGIMSAISAKIHNPDLSVTVLERSEKALKKLLATGNGRCNMLNTDIKEENFHGSDTKKVLKILDKVSSDFLSDFFYSLGLETTKRFSPLIYPNSMQAASVREALLTAAYERGVKIFCDFEITEITALNDGFSVKNKKGKELICRKLILAGGTAATTGSVSCADMLTRLGHRLLPYYPALCPLVCKESGALKLANGARAYGSVTLLSEGKKIKSDFGEIQFTDYGLSGIVTMQLSGDAVRLLNDGRGAEISVCLFENEEQVLKKLISSRSEYKRISIFSRLCLMINSSVASAVLFMADIEEDNPFSALSESEIKKISNLLCDMRFSLSGSKGEKHAQVFGGGIALDEFDEKLCSKINSNLYAAGEMLDVYGDCGGYNLTWAWASGYTAGKYAALTLKPQEDK